MMKTIETIQASLNEVLDAEKRLLKAQEGFSQTLSRAASGAGLSFYGAGAGRYDSERRVESLIKEASYMVLRLFLNERGVGEDALERLKGYGEIRDRIENAQTGDLISLYKELDGLLPKDEAADVASTHAATELARCMRLGKWRWRGNGIEFDVWASLMFDASFTFNTVSRVMQVERHLRTFMKRRSLPWHAHDGLEEKLSGPVVSRARIVVARDAESNDRIELVTYKGKVSFRITGELANDYLAWIHKYAEQERLAA